MTIEIDIHEDIVDELYRYCERSHAELEPTMERAVRPWLNSRVQKKYREQREDGELNDIVEAINESRPDESELTTIGIDATWARSFKKMCDHWGFDPAALMTHLGQIFLMSHNIEEMNELKDKRDVDKFGSLY